MSPSRAADPTVEGSNYVLYGDLGKIDLDAGSVRMVVAPEKIVRS